MSPEACDLLSKLCYFMAAISACVAVGGWVGYQHIQANRRDGE